MFSVPNFLIATGGMFKLYPLCGYTPIDEASITFFTLDTFFPSGHFVSNSHNRTNLRVSVHTAIRVPRAHPSKDIACRAILICQTNCADGIKIKLHGKVATRGYLSYPDCYNFANN